MGLGAGKQIPLLLPDLEPLGSRGKNRRVQPWCERQPSTYSQTVHGAMATGSLVPQPGPAREPAPQGHQRLSFVCPALPPTHQPSDQHSSIPRMAVGREPACSGNIPLQRSRGRREGYPLTEGLWGRYKVVPHSESPEVCLILNISLKCHLDAHRRHFIVRDLHDKESQEPLLLSGVCER